MSEFGPGDLAGSCRPRADAPPGAVCSVRLPALVVHARRVSTAVWRAPGLLEVMSPARLTVLGGCSVGPRLHPGCSGERGDSVPRLRRGVSATPHAAVDARHVALFAALLGERPRWWPAGDLGCPAAASQLGVVAVAFLMVATAVPCIWCEESGSWRSTGLKVEPPSNGSPHSALQEPGSHSGTGARGTFSATRASPLGQRILVLQSSL